MDILQKAWPSERGWVEWNRRVRNSILNHRFEDACFVVVFSIFPFRKRMVGDGRCVVFHIFEDLLRDKQPSLLDGSFSFVYHPLFLLSLLPLHALLQSVVDISILFDLADSILLVRIHGVAGRRDEPLRP